MRLASCMCTAVVLTACGPVFATDSNAVRSQFADPPRQYSSAPLWVWNDMLTDDMVLRSLRGLAAQKVKQAFVHPRPGLMTPYLSPEWFRLWKAALAEAERLDMNLWIYDENSYPSGFAGGWVPELMPESRGQGLKLLVTKLPGKIDDDVLAVFRLGGNSAENVTQKARAGQKMPAGQYLTASVKRAKDSAWFGGRYYVDLLRPGVTEKFLEVTLEAYRREIGAQFGRRMPGSFTDEPNLVSAAGPLPWTERLPEEFQDRWGYSLLDNLASLNRPVGDWKRVRHDYYRLLSELFIERWAKPYHDYCQQHGLEFTGHYWEHDWPRCVGVPDNMAMYAWSHRPSIDCLFNQYQEHVNAQFGNLHMVKQLGSAANQIGAPRTLCETYGGGGWDLRFEDMKRIGDWLCVLGVNTINQHIADVSIRGSRKSDYPQIFSDCEPWWEAYHTSAEYFTRLSLAISSGQEVNSILVIEPTTTVWMYQADAAQAKRLHDIGSRFFDLVLNLSKDHVEYDIGCEDIMARHGSVDGRRLTVGRRAYDVVVLPPCMETLNDKTIGMLESFAAAGGRIFCCGEAPALVDARPSDRGAKLAAQPGWRQIESAALAAALLKPEADTKPQTPALAIHRAAGDGGILLHQRRQLDDGELLFLVNTSIDAPTAGTIESAMRGVERWDLESGKAVAYQCQPTDGGVKTTFSLPPCGSLLLFLSNSPLPAPPAGETDAKTPVAAVAPGGDMTIHRIEPNVLTLDYLDVSAGGETLKNVYIYKACQFAFEKNGLPGGNPWDHAVQFRDELITKKFPANSGFGAAYRFTIEGQPPKSLWLVVERPDLYAIACNGRPVTAAPGQWWLDRSFGKIDIAAAAQSGENVVTLKAAPMTMYHELAAIYVLGDFALQPAKSGFTVTADVPLTLGPWNAQGSPLYAAGVSYSQRFSVPQPKGRYRVRLPKWYGSVAKVSVNGRTIGYIGHQPWQLDVTEAIKPGENTVDVVVIGTLKNTLGPHHGNPPLGIASPLSFRNAPASGPPRGRDYSTVGYGLFEPFVLEAVE